MDGNLLKEARLEKNWTQEQAALALGVTQAYLSMMEKGHRPLSERFVRKAVKVLNLPATALPLRSGEAAMPASSQKHNFGADLGALGYPGFSYLRARRRRNPAEVLLEALNQPNLDARVVEGLPWFGHDLRGHGLGLAGSQRQGARSPESIRVCPLSGVRTIGKEERERADRETSAAVGGFGEFATCARRYLLPRLDDSSGESVAAQTSLARRNTLESPD